MKKFCYLLLLAILFVSSCNNDKSKVTTTEKDDDGTVTKTEVDVKGMTSKADEMTVKMEALKKMKPLTIEEMKAMLPETLDGVKQSNYNASATMGYAFVGVEFKKDSRNEVKVQLFDCAGEMGSAFYASAFWTSMNYQQENDEGYTKSIDFMNGRAIEAYNKNNKESTLTYVVNDRLLVILEGKNMSPEELKAAAQKLNIKA
ncbi:MAG: hypothetical protein ACXWB9_09035 [Flavisolibacter sp.]